MVHNQVLRATRDLKVLKAVSAVHKDWVDKARVPAEHSKVTRVVASKIKVLRVSKDSKDNKAIRAAAEAWVLSAVEAREILVPVVVKVECNSSFLSRINQS